MISWVQADMKICINDICILNELKTKALVYERF